jgi:hypothetical protein
MIRKRDQVSLRHEDRLQSLLTFAVPAVSGQTNPECLKPLDGQQGPIRLWPPGWPTWEAVVRAMWAY